MTNVAATSIKEVEYALFLALLGGEKGIEYQVKETNDLICISKDSGDYFGIGVLEHYTVTYLEYAGDLLYFTNDSEYFPISKLHEAIESYIARIDPKQGKTNFGYSLTECKNMDKVS